MDKKQVFLLRLSETVNADEWDSANVYNTYKGWLTPEDGVGEDVSFYSHNNSQMIKEQIKGAEFKEISSDIFLVDCWDHFDGLKENCFKSKVLENLADYRVYIRRNIFSLIHKKIWQSKSFIGETGSLRRIGLATGIRDEYDKKGMKYQKKFLSLKFEYDAYSGNPIDYYFFLGFSREEIDIIITSISKYWENQRETIIEAQREKEKEQRRKEKEQEENRIKDRIIELSNKRESAELGQNYTLEELVDALELGVIDKNSLSIDVIVKKLGSPPELDYDNVFGRGLIVLLEYGEVAVEPFWELFQPVAYTERYEELINDYEKILDKVVEKNLLSLLYRLYDLKFKTFFDYGPMDFSELNCLKVLEPRASEYCLEILDKGDLDSVFPAIYCLGYLQCSDAFRKICIRLEEYIELCLRNSDWDGFAYYIDMCINTIFKLKGSDQNGYDKTDMRILLSLVLKIINKALNPVAHEFSEDNFKILINIVDNEEVYEHLIRVLETKEESGFAELLLAFDILYNLKRPELNLLLTKTVIHFIYDIEGFDSGDFYLKEIGKLEDENALELIVDSVGDRLYFVETIIKSNKVTSQNLKTWKKLLTKIDSQSKLVKLVENKINAFEEKK